MSNRLPFFAAALTFSLMAACLTQTARADDWSEVCGWTSEHAANPNFPCDETTQGDVDTALSNAAAEPVPFIPAPATGTGTSASHGSFANGNPMPMTLDDLHNAIVPVPNQEPTATDGNIPVCSVTTTPTPRVVVDNDGNYVETVQADVASYSCNSPDQVRTQNHRAGYTAPPATHVARPGEPGYVPYTPPAGYTPGS